MIDIETYEQLWIDKLKAVPGIQTAMTITEVMELEQERLVRFPAAFVMFASLPFEDPLTLDRVVQEGVVEWSVYVVAESMRGPRAARLGGTGAFAMVNAVCEACVGWHIEPGYRVWVRNIGPWNLPEIAKAGYEIRFAHQFDISQVP